MPRYLRSEHHLFLVLACSAALGLYQLDWGLAFGTNDWTHSWTVDAMEPLIALGIVRRSFSSWNSGWFYFKYPLGYPLLLSAALSPYLGYLFVTKQVHQLSSSYPYGLSKPEHALLILALIQRVLNVTFVVATVALVYGLSRRLFDKRTGYLAAWFAATCYPVVYYAHTSNVDASYVFWLTLALYCAMIAGETDAKLPWTGLGLAAGMAMCTKEQAFGFLLPLPFLALAARAHTHGTARAWWSAPALAMAATAVVTVLVADNILFNPLGFVARLAFLLGHPLKPIAAPLKPVEFHWFKGAYELTHLRQLAAAMGSGLGVPLTCLIVVGMAVVVWRAPRRVAWLLLPMLGYYYLSLRGQGAIRIRYCMPLFVVAVIPAAAFLMQELGRHAQRKLMRLGVLSVIGALSLLGVARGIELTLLLRNDSRRQAERWIQAHLSDGARGETYQKPTYLPRFARRLNVSFIEMPQRSIAEFRKRQPDFVVVSSASHDTISQVWNPDWQKTRTFALPVADAAQFVEALELGTLGYRSVATFRQHPRLLHLSTTGLCPQITIYQRDGGP
ncbi:MAG: ArnT family glycosyltransferase [Candidatus Binatia bacterium]